MHIVISPSKALYFEKSCRKFESFNLVFPAEAQEIMSSLRKYNPEGLEELMKISPALATLNFGRNQEWKWPFEASAVKPALFAFHGDVYEGLNAESLADDDIRYANNQLTILSGLYGILRPLDNIMPYRLEMGTKLKVGSNPNLYRYWGNKITSAINERMRSVESQVLVNLASDEYFKSVKGGTIGGRVVTPEFKDEKNGEFKVISFYAKRARGLMTRFIITHRLSNPDDLAGFAEEGYFYEPQMSTADKPVFIRLQKK